MIKLNRYLKQIIFLSVLLIPVISSGVGYARPISNQPSVTFDNNVTSDSHINSKLQQNPQPVFFQPGNFGNGTSINVTRNILVNSWAYTTLTDKVSIFTNESSFNAFTYTLPNSLFSKVDHIDLSLKNSSTHELARTVDKGANNTVITFTLYEQSKKIDTTFTITLGINDLVSSDKNNQDYPFSFSGVNFLPWFNFPITNYYYSGGIKSSITIKSVNENSTTYAPNPASLGLTQKSGQNFAIDSFVLNYSVMTQLPNFNYTSIRNEYQNAGNRRFIPAFENQIESNFTYPVQFKYNINQAPIKYTHSSVSITVSQWGMVTYKELTTLVDMGTGQSISGQADNFIPIWINANQLNSLIVTDFYGNLSKTTQSRWESGKGYPTNTTQVKISPRSQLQAGSTYSFEMQYSIPANRFLNETGGFFSPAYNVSLPAMSMFNWTNRQVDLTIDFPALSSVALPDTLWGVPVSGANISSGLLGLGHLVLHLSLNNFSSLDNVFEHFQLSMLPVIGPFFPVFENAIYLFFIGLLIIIVRTTMQRFSFIVETQTKADVQIPFELMRDFVTAYEEKTALRSRLAELEKRRKNLRKVEYEQLVQTLKNKQLTNDKKLVSVTSNLVKVSPVYKDSIHNLELAEAERDQILAQIADLDEKKKQSRIRPEIYNKLKSEQNNRLNKSISRIERVLNELRSLLREAK